MREPFDIQRVVGEATGDSSALPMPVPGDDFTLDDARTGRLRCYFAGPEGSSGRAPILLVHSANAAASAYEVRPVFEHCAKSRPTYALDLPGFGLSDRSDRVYSARLMTDAVHVIAEEILRRHGGVAIDALALSTGCEFLARAANEQAFAYRRVALVSPTGFSEKKRRLGPAGKTREIPWMHAILSAPFWADFLFALLTRPGSIRFFLERTWGAKNIDEGLFEYDRLSVKQPGAKNAPFWFVAGNLFSADVNALYDHLEMPVWMSHGVRGSFSDFRGADAMKSRKNWHFTVFETGAMPYFEVPVAFMEAADAFFR